MIASNRAESATSRYRLVWLALALLPFVSIPLLGAHLYFRHDDSALLLWAKEFEQPFYHTLSPDPAVNGFNKYRGMGSYWRPFSYLYIKTLWDFFGTTPGPYHVVGGLLFMVAVYFLFRLAEQRWDLAAAVTSCLALFAAFYGAMYNLFHIAVQIGFFCQLALLYCFWAYLQQQRWQHLLGILLFLAPAMGRMTTPVLMVAILTATLIEQRCQGALFLRQNWLAIALLVPAFYLITLSPHTSEASVLALGANTMAIAEFLRERFFYYGRLLTSSLTGIFMLSLLGGAVLQKWAGFFKTKFHFNKVDWFWPPLALLLTFTLPALQPYAIYWLVFCCIYLFVFDAELRLPLAWAGASMCCFLSAQYYHNGYLLESGFAFALAMGVLMTRFGKPIVSACKKISISPRATILALTGGAMLLSAPVMLVLMGKAPFVSDSFEVVRTAIASNQNFQQLMSYLQQDMPRAAALYEFTEEELGTTRFERRHISLRERAARAKIMNLEDKQNMLKVLDRDDLKIHSAEQLHADNVQEEAYFIALNNFERKIANKRFALEMVKEFHNPADSAAVYRIIRDRPRRAVQNRKSP